MYDFLGDILERIHLLGAFAVAGENHTKLTLSHALGNIDVEVPCREGERKRERRERGKEEKREKERKREREKERKRERERIRLVGTNMGA